tara:strand:- start:129 stop:1502 length:1374 start_codon:yes stop_codon:yes gene_type:complete
MNANTALKLDRHISVFFLALMLFVSPILSPMAKGTAKYFIIDAELQGHLNNLARPILIKAGLPPGVLKIFIIKDDSIGAFVTPGMKLFIHTGLIMRTKTPSQLLGVLAHEIGHIAAGHLIRRKEAIEDSQNITAVGLFLGSLAAATTQSGEVAAAAAFGTQNARINSLLKFSRSQENAADQAAVNYLIATNISPFGMLEFLKTLEKEESLIIDRRSQYATTHPNTHDRINFVKNQIDLYPDLSTRLDAQKRDRHDRIIAKLIGFLTRPEETFQKYPRSNTTIAAKYAQAIAFYKEAHLAKAITELDHLITLEKQNPYFWELKGQILLEKNEKEMARAAYKKAYSFSRDVMILQQLAKVELLLNTQRSNSDALKHLEKVIRKIPESPATWKQLAIAQGRNGQMVLAQLSLAEEALLRGDYARALKKALFFKRNLTEDLFTHQRALDIIKYAEQAQDRR